MAQFKTQEAFMIKKRPIYPQRIRRIPSQFSWVDHRLVRDRHIEACSHPALALYLFLVTVADREGLSYYSAPSVMSRLGMDAQTLAEARLNLIETGPKAQSRTRVDCPVSIGRLFKQILGESS